MKTNAGLRSHCPVNYVLEMLGDRWSLLILRDMVFRGKRSYGEFLKAEEGWATNILAARLDRLVADGILERSDDALDGRKGVYTPTEKGLDLIPLLFEMMLWSEKHDALSEAKRVPRMLAAIRADNRGFSAAMREKVRRGEPIVRDFVDPR